VFYVALGRLAGAGKAGSPGGGGQRERSWSTGWWRRLVPFLALSTFTQAVILSVVAMIPLYLVDHFGVAEEKAAALIALVYSSGLWAGPIGGHLSDRLGRVTVVVAVCFIAAPVIYLLGPAPYPWGISALLVALGIIIYVRMPVSEAYIVGVAPQKHRSMILGIYYFSSMEGSGILTPVVGNLIDRFGFHTTFAMAAVAVVAVTLACSVWLWGSRD
jgi:MFS family permease